MADEVKNIEQVKTDFAQARWRVSAYLQASLGPDALVGDEIRTAIIEELATGTVDQMVAFIDVLTTLHLTVMLQDVDYDQEHVAADIRTLTEPSADRFFEKLVQNVRNYTATLPPASETP